MWAGRSAGGREGGTGEAGRIKRGEERKMKDKKMVNMRDSGEVSDWLRRVLMGCLWIALSALRLPSFHVGCVLMGMPY